MHHAHVQHNHDSYDQHQGHSPEMFKRKFWLTLILTVPTLIFSPAMQHLLGYQIDIPFGQYLPAILGTIIFMYGGLVFLKGARGELASRRPGMMTLISMAITVAFVYSLAVTFRLVEGMDFWWELATLVVIMLLGHWLEMASVMSAQNALKELARLLPDDVEIVSDGKTITAPLSSVSVGDVMIVRPGGKIPVDGEVVDGDSRVNESMLTGESMPIKKLPGDSVIGGTINEAGVLTIRATRIGDETALAGIMHLVAEAQKSRSRTQMIADRAAYYLTFIAIIAALATALSWMLAGDRSAAFILERVVTVLVIACPHALGLAVPLVTAISTSLAAQNGLLIRQRPALENARNAHVVLFDKTGTLTKGEQGVVEIVTEGADKRSVLGWAAAVETSSEHPIARAIVRSAEKEMVVIERTVAFSALAGRGATAKIDGMPYYVGGPQLITELNLAIPAALKASAKSAGDAGQTVVFVIRDDQVKGMIALADILRDESRLAIDALKRAGMRVAMLTGDSKEVAAWVAGKLGIDEYFAEVLPENKATTVKKLQQDGSRVIMVGDGVNDAPALTQADIGIAIGAGTDVAIESAGIVLAGSDPSGVAKVVTLSKATYRKMVQNLWWATGYNLIAIPLAAGVTAGLGYVLSPALGAVLMSLSTIVVALNAQFLRRLKL